MIKKYNINQFRKDYPDDDACLHKLFELRYSNLVCPKCDSDKPFTRVKNRRSYQCPCCAFQLYPTAGTPFHNCKKPLTYWFYAIFLMTTTRNGVAAKELERLLNISYPTALRMAHQVKKLMGANNKEKLTGIVEIDESYSGGKFALMNKSRRQKHLAEDGTFMDNKTGIMGFVSRDGEVRTEVMNDAKTFKERVRNHVAPEAIVVTDSHAGYVGLDAEYFKHEVINKLAGEYRREEWHTNTIEGFWSQLKRMLKGTHIHCQAKYLQLYADEAAFRYMNRKRQDEMFHLICNS
jgi:transposase-like protein